MRMITRMSPNDTVLSPSNKTASKQYPAPCLGYGGAWSGAVGQATGNILLQRPLRFWSKLNTFQIAHSYFRNRLSHYRRLGRPRKKKARLRGEPGL